MRGHRYTQEQDSFLRIHYPGGVNRCLHLFNERFNISLTYGALKSHARRMGLKTTFRKWTPEMNVAIAEILSEYPYAMAVQVFNERFGTNFTRKQVEYHCTKVGIKRNHAAILDEVDRIISENIDKPYQEIKAIINELTAQKYISGVTVCVRANNMGLKRPHRAWSKTDKRTINGNSVTLSEYSSFIGHRFHRLDPELQGIALLVAKLQVGLNTVVETKSEE